MEYLSDATGKIAKGLFIWAKLAQLGGLYVHTEFSVSVQSKRFLCRWKKIDQAFFYNKQWGKAIMQNKSSFII